MSRRVRPRRDFAAMEERRMQARSCSHQPRSRGGSACVIRSSPTGALYGDGLAEMGCALLDVPVDCRR